MQRADNSTRKKRLTTPSPRIAASLAPKRTRNQSPHFENRNRCNSFIQKEKTFSIRNKSALFPPASVGFPLDYRCCTPAPIYSTGISNARKYVQTKEKTFSALR